MQGAEYMCKFNLVMEERWEARPEDGMMADLFCICMVMLVPAGMSWSILPQSFLKFLSAAALIHTTKCSSYSTVNSLQRV